MKPVIIDIEHTAGDTFNFDFKVKDSVAPLAKAYFSVRSRPKADDYILQVSLENGITEVEESTYRVNVAKELTKDLPWNAEYYYDLALFFGSSKVTPIKGKFCLGWNVTREVEE